jgi:hypothetical protein
MQFDLIEQICLTELTRRDRHRYGTGQLYRDIIETLSLPEEQRAELQTATGSPSHAGEIRGVG